MLSVGSIFGRGFDSHRLHHLNNAVITTDYADTLQPNPGFQISCAIINRKLSSWHKIRRFQCFSTDPEPELKYRRH
jgi:hypothetical protein